MIIRKKKFEKLKADLARAERIRDEHINLAQAYSSRLCLMDHFDDLESDISKAEEKLRNLTARVDRIEDERHFVSNLLIEMARGGQDLPEDIRRLRLLYGQIADITDTPPPASVPVPMLLRCPECNCQHVDRPDGKDWANPPHRSHLCANCDHIWRPSDWATTGVDSLRTSGKNDTPGAS